MKLIIAGSRNFGIGIATLEDILYHFEIEGEIEEVVSGRARGIDSLGEHYADCHNLDCIMYPADWDKYGKSAGPMRNKEMAEYADALLLIWDGESRGSKNMKSQMEKLNKPIYEMILRK